MKKATRSHTGAPKDRPELVIIRHEREPRLTWEIKLDTDIEQRGDLGEPVQWIGYVDAITGEVIRVFNNIQTAGPVVATGTGYYSGAGAVNAWFDDTNYQLRDTTRTAMGGPEIVTNDEDGASPSADPDGNWNTLSTAPRDANQGAEIDAHRYTGNVIDYFQTVHGRNSFDGAAATPTTLVHAGTNLTNGYWDGAKVNLGDGDAAPADDYECSDDWLAHEWTHAYTQYTCGLQYVNESGALNEAFSDVFAAFITGDWLVFEDTWRRPTAPAWRNMVDPTNGGQWNLGDPIGSTLAGHQPSHYSVRYVGGWDNGGVHVNSGIINNLFYLLTVGGTHTVSGISVAGIGQSAAEQMLWRCMTTNLVGNPTATFLDFREAMLDACLDLYPTDLFKLTNVKRAFNAVGIGPDIYVRDNLTDTGEEPFPGSYLYASPDIISRTSIEPNPAVAFADLTIDSYWQNVEFGQDNYVYVRLQNRGPEMGDATVHVFFSSATTFGTPASWIPVGVLTESGIAPGSVRIAGPLTFHSASIPAPGHYCMIAAVSSSLDPAPDHTLITTVGEYLEYVRNTNNIAYRNMDVVDMVPGVAHTLEAVVRGLGRSEKYRLDIDDRRFIPGVQLYVRAPAKALDGADARGLRLIKREGEENVYRVMAGKERLRWLQFLEPLANAGGNGNLLRRPVAGFANVAVEEEFRIRVEYEVPDDEQLKRIAGQAGRRPFELTIRQSWGKELVGGVGIRLQ